MLILLAIDIPAVAALVAMGRRLETRFRIAFLEKLPRIADQYFHSRPASDMAARSHSIHNIRALPGLAGQLLHSVFELAVTTIAVIWIDPRLWPVATLAAIVAIGVPFFVQPLVGERELRVRTHAGALSRFYLDTLLGLIAIRTHAGESAVRDEHRNLLSKWASASMAMQRVSIRMEGIQMAVGYGLAALLMVLHISRYPESPALLLLAYWSLNIPTLGRELASQACNYPMHRNIALRMLEPLSAMEGGQRNQLESFTKPAVADENRGAAIQIQDVSVVAGGHSILNNITVDIRGGSHVAILGTSGAGKSSLVNLLLGGQTPAAGRLQVDQSALEGHNLEKLRRGTAWIAPTVQLWNRSLAENIRYGLDGELSMMLGDVLDGVDLSRILEKLSDGLQTGLGEGGALLSGGEGQRVRIGRGVLRPKVRLAILDEPFRGLEPDTRRSQLQYVRRIWRDATILFVTHDVADTRDFDRVLVMERGTIVEDGVPAELSRDPSSLYSALLFREIELKRNLLYHPQWRRLSMRQGTLAENAEESSVPAANISMRETSA
jgi:ATP-binding cassette subfamily B protein